MNQNCYNEEELLHQLARGSEEAFTVIYNKYWKKLYFLAHKHLKSPQAAEEIVQDVFLAVWKSRTKLKIQTLPIYLAAMTRYMVYRHLAKQKKLIHTEIKEDNQSLSISNQESVLDNKLMMEIIQNLSNELPEKCRLVFTHIKFLDQPLKQVAAEMNISTKTAEAHLTKALKIIRSNLKEGLFSLFCL